MATPVKRDVRHQVRVPRDLWRRVAVRVREDDDFARADAPMSMAIQVLLAEACEAREKKAKGRAA